MEDILFRSDRYFVLNDTVFSHGQLLLRAQRGTDHPANLDIVFFGAGYIQLYTKLHGLSIRIADKQEYKGYPVVQKDLAEGDRLFELTSGGERYYIVATRFNVYETGHHFNESALRDFDSGWRQKLIYSSQ